MSFGDEVDPEREPDELEPGDRPVDVRLAGDDARRARELSRRLGMPTASVVRLALLKLTDPPVRMVGLDRGRW